MNFFNDLNNVIWTFPFGIYGLAAAVLASTAVVIFSYTHTVRPLKLYQKIILAAIRSALCLLAILLVCDPRKQEKETLSIQTEPKIVTAFDVSGSMIKPSAKKRTRLEESIRAFKILSEKNGDGFKYEHISFSGKPESITGIEALAGRKTTPARNDEGTDLKSAMEELFAKAETSNAGATVLFTDGIDTELTNIEEMKNLAAESGKMFIVYPMRLEVPQVESLSISRLEAPSFLPLGNSGSMLAVIRKSNMSENDKIQLRVSVNGLPLETLDIPNTNGLKELRCKIKGDSPGIYDYRAELIKNGKVHSFADWRTEIRQLKETCRVILYSGAFDWGTRHIREVIENDERNKLDIIYDPSQYPGAQKTPGAAFPNAKALEEYDVVILMNLLRNQITPAMEKDIDSFVKNGGGILFLGGNPVNAAEFAASPLEKLLPVKFSAKTNTEKRDDANTMRLLNSMRGDSSPYEQQFTRERENSLNTPALHDFTLTPTGMQSNIFKYVEDASEKHINVKFQDIAFTDSAKPGANVFAVWKNNNKEHILLAAQNYGRGRSMVMACDPLWRWKLTLDSKKRSFHHFYRNIFQFLAGNSNLKTYYWSISNYAITAKEPPLVRFSLPDTSININSLTFILNENNTASKMEMAYSTDGKTCTITLKNLAQGKAYTINAVHNGKTLSSTRFATIPENDVPKEERNTAPDESFFRAMAELPNTIIADADFPPDLKAYFSTGKIELDTEQTKHLWHTKTLLAIMLALAALEWITRRTLKLV